MHDCMEQMLRLTVIPTVQWMGHRYASPAAAAMLCAIAHTESGCLHRKQIRGPARSWWQIEPPTGLDLLNRFPQTAGHFWGRLHLPPVKSSAELRPILQYSELGACVLARLLLWHRIRAPLPELADQAVEEGLRQYLSAWRPGKPHPERFRKAWPVAVDLVVRAWP